MERSLEAWWAGIKDPRKKCFREVEGRDQKGSYKCRRECHTGKTPRILGLSFRIQVCLCLNSGYHTHIQNCLFPYAKTENL